MPVMDVRTILSVGERETWITAIDVDNDISITEVYDASNENSEEVAVNELLRFMRRRKKTLTLTEKREDECMFSVTYK